MQDAPLTLMSGQTTHVRFMPFEQRFSYKLFMIDLDIDRLDEVGAMSSLFKINSPGLFSFSEADHGARGETSLRVWAERKFKAANVDLKGGSIRLMTFPRHLFYKFAPISLWFGHDIGGQLQGVIYEVNNTFGETHSYVARAQHEALNRHQADKTFHVSPFFDVSGKYQFKLRAWDEGVNLVVDSISDAGRTHMATINAKRRPASSSTLLKAALSRPLSSLGVTAGIHWEALKLWLKGAKYHSRPAPPVAEMTVAAGLSEET